ncbi:MAG: metallophosphoesterase [Candidatus Accumulibacter sp.]|nr:metallophosphoesterase [Accumulibacter sp.]
MNTIASRRPLTLHGLWLRLKAIAARLGFGWGHNLRLGDTYRLGSSKVRVPLDSGPIEISLGMNDKRLHLYPEMRLNERGKAIRNGNFIIGDPSAHPGRIGGFLRLTPKSWVSLGSADALQRAVFDYPAAVDDEHLVVIHSRDALVFRNLSDAGAAIGPAVVADITAARGSRFRRLRQVLGGPIGLLPAVDALDLIQEVNGLMRQDAYRPRSDLGTPGGLLLLPRSVTPILVADMHGQVDNLLTVLSQNAFLDAIEDGSAALIILGDAVHCEVDGRLREMQSSMLLMDLIFRLKQRFPRQVFYVRGNHDSFSEDIAKDGIPQGLLWAKELSDQRGTVYLRAMEEFYRLLPYIVSSDDFVACHAAAPKAEVSLPMLVNIHRHPELIVELINNRLRRPNRPQGYSRGDVKRLRRSLQLDKHTPFIVGHTPMDREGTLWLNVDGITNHHVLFSAHPDHVAVFTRVDGVLVPLVYPVDAVSSIINGLEEEDACQVVRRSSRAGREARHA